MDCSLPRDHLLMGHFEAKPSFLEILSSELVIGDQREGSRVREFLCPLLVLFRNQGP